MEDNIQDTVDKAGNRVGDNLIKRATNSKYTTSTEELSLLNKYALVWIVNNLRRYQGLTAYDILLRKLQEIA